MRGVVFFVAFVALGACSNEKPPPIGDSDGSISQFDDDAWAPPVFVDAGVDAGTTELLDFEGTCTSSGFVPVWHFFDFQTHTPSDSSLVITASTADSQAGLASAQSVALATVSGPDITTWTGVDVAMKLTSKLFLRVSIAFVPATDGTPPVLVHYRQEYDCIVQ